MGVGGQHCRREPRRHRRGYRLRRGGQRRHPGREARRRREDHRRRPRGSQARQGIRVRRNPLRYIDAGGHRTRRRADPRSDGGFRAAHRRAGGGRDDQRGARHHPQGRCGRADGVGSAGGCRADIADDDVHALPEAIAGQPVWSSQRTSGHTPPAEPLPRGQATPRRDRHREYKLNDINEAYDDMLAGRNIRGVVIHDH